MQTTGTGQGGLEKSMTLFRPEDIQSYADASLGSSDAFSNELIESLVVGKGMKAISELIPLPLEEGRVIYFISDGCWSMHHLTQYVLNAIGPSHIHLATWSISEFSARQLTGWLHSGMLISINGVLDFRSKNRHAEAFHLAKQNFTNLKLANCHAKVTVLHNEKWKITINGSPNWTENPRLESGSISVCGSIADRFIMLIDQLIQKSEYDIQ